MKEPFAFADARLRFARALSPRSAIELVGQSSAASRVEELVRRAAVLDGGVLIAAEPGVATDGVAYELHLRSRRAAGPYITVECSSVDGSRIDRLMFGTPAAQGPTDLESVAADSRVAAACGGTLYLKDVAELPAAVQAKLARIARDGEVRIDGVPVALGWRIVCSAAPSIEADVETHRLRPDLFRRIAAARIDLPPLRERPEDVPAMAMRLLGEIAEETGPPRTLTNAAVALLSALTWPGNVDELRRVLERVAAATRDDVIQVEHLLPALRLHAVPAPFTPNGSLREARLRFEREYIASVLQHHGWRMAEAAQTLGIQRPNLYRKARQLGIPLARVAE